MRYYTHKDYYECPQHSLFAMTKGHPFGRLVVSAGDYLRRRVPEVSVLVFLMSGSIRILRNNAREKEISSGSMILLPKFACAYGTALTDCEFFIVKVPDGDGQGTDGAGVSFRVSARAWETEGKELVRLYIAERLPEHNHQGEDLHCDTFMDLEWTDGSGNDGSSVSDPGYVYTLEGMLAQWYKFAFVAVPDGIGWTVTVGEESYTEVLDGKSMLQDGFSEGLCDFNGIYIDYTRVMEAQEDDVDLIRRGDDLHVYRKIIDRWLYPDELRTEDVTLTRMTGLLSLNMGIPEDQFPGKVTEITVLMTSVPVKAYLRDMADGSVTVLNDTKTYAFTYTGIPWNERKEFVMDIAMLPHVLEDAVVYVRYECGSGQYDIVTDNDGKVAVKPATRTTVVFNGIADGFREVRYAGFPDGTEVDVAGDEWDTVE